MKILRDETRINELFYITCIISELTNLEHTIRKFTTCEKNTNLTASITKTNEFLQ